MKLNISLENFDSILIFAQNTDCEGVTTAKIREIGIPLYTQFVYPYIPQFYYTKVRCRGYALHEHVLLIRMLSCKSVL